MKHKKLAWAALAAFCCAATTSYAQGSITPYGIIDEAVQWQSNVNGGKKVVLDSLNGISGSRLGFAGAEELGSGLHAIFTLESGLNVPNGTYAQGGTAFGRQAFVGLSSDKYGALTLGRQYDMIFYFPLPLYGGAVVGTLLTHPAELDNTADSIRLNNSIRYMSPDIRGFKFGGEYFVGGVSGNTTANSGYSVGGSYANGPFSAAVAFLYFKNPVSTTAGSGYFTAYANGVSLLSNSINKGYNTTQAFQNAVVALNYKMGALTFGASYSNVQYADLGSGFLTRSAIFNNADIGVRWQITPSWTVATGYDYLKASPVTTSTGRVVGNQHYSQVAILTDYFLSKRTDLYGGASYQRASGTSSLGTPAVADIANYGDSSNNHMIMVRAAIRHKF
ncbi:porin [Paraburkholderia sp. BL21I4N1]|uniref:porin n=1 Tax=Paraburkholderia sp. BL21I4N1 TaxID=1938801 RepID=UPI000CFCCB63|nr:porin [Paraburkholderia sp. BL21I4N1]PQV43536.1 putative porin [Paraburkholderia sp. BL21I4N1]